MKLEEQGDLVSRFLLGPIFLLHDFLAALVPGGFFLLMLAFKGNATVRHLWFSLPFGYKTNVALALVISYIVGKLLMTLTSPFLLVKQESKKTGGFIDDLPVEIRKMLTGAMSDGVFATVPGLAEKLAVQHADVAFHAGMSISLIVAAAIPGDGRFRWLELACGAAFFFAGTIRWKFYIDSIPSSMGIGFAHVISRMSKDQFQIAKAVFDSLKKSGQSVPQPDEHVESTAGATSVNTTSIESHLETSQSRPSANP